MIKTIIVEDDPMVAQINRRYLDTANDIQVAAEFNNGKDALAYIETEEPDLV
ncbi:MAG: response regulator, partial [Pyramidobacter sp.]|nr:response regulator [Pyramidobacter sp.]